MVSQHVIIERDSSKFNCKFLNAHVHAVFEKAATTVEEEGRVVEEKFTISWVREFRAEYTGSSLGGSVANFLDPKYLRPIVLRTSDDVQGLEFLVDYYGIRYHLLMEYNKETEGCKENECLTKIYDAIHDDDRDKEQEGVIECLDLFWPHVAEDCEGNPRKSADTPTLSDRYRSKETCRIQLKTLEDGRFGQVSHKLIFNFPLSEPIENPCPNVPLFSKDEIEVLEEITPRVLKVKIRGEICCLKFENRKQLSREIAVLSKMPEHCNLPSLVGVVDAGEGRVDRFVTNFVSGRCLDDVQSINEQQKRDWKAQIADAVRVLHENGIIWGDVQPQNIMIEDEYDRAVLIDFGDSFNTKFVDPKLRGTKEGDNMGVHNVEKYIDELFDKVNATSSLLAK